jgi:predicted ATPase/DNA-binding SARP family transcriptional activator
MSEIAQGRAPPRQQLVFRILGPLEVEGDAGPVAVAGRKQRALLGLLLLHAGEVVSSDRLVDELWGERPPATAASSLRNLIAQLRTVLGPNTIVTRQPGYLLVFESQRLDRDRFERLVAEARGVEPGERVRLLREALALWRGPPLADLAFERFAHTEVQRLEELRLEALEERIEAELELGQGAELVAELEALVAEQPLRERLRAQLMLAFYRSGRQAEALEAYQAARRMLVEELGVEPSPALQELQGAILRQEPGLAPAPRPEARTRLPAQPTPFLGRTRELVEVVALLQRADVRLLTLSGAGGSGKTRLALRAAAEVAADYPDGVWWVPLAGLRDPALVPATIAQALNIKHEEQLAARVGDQRLLVLLDNCEHLLASAPALGELLSLCPNLNVLATSREPIHLAAEREYLVPTLREWEALELFRQRAYAAQPEDAVLTICRRLDCLPLAVELAAARTKLLPPKALLQRLDNAVPLLTGGPRDAPERQRTLEATIAWSYDLLNESEQRLFANLAVFPGGCTLESAEQVAQADLDVLQSLVDKNMLCCSEQRFWMLETIREYATTRLEDKDGDENAWRRHAEYFLTAAEVALERQRVPELIAERDNLRAALRWSTGVGDSDLSLRLATACAPVFWYLNPAEGRRWLELTLRARSQRTSPQLRADALYRLGYLANDGGDHAAAAHYLRQSVAESRACGDRRLLAKALIELSSATWAEAPESVAEARALVEEAHGIHEALADLEGIALALRQLGELNREAGDLRTARRLLERALSMQPIERVAAAIVHALGDVALDEHDFGRAESCYRESLTRVMWDSGNERYAAYALAGLAAVAAARGDLQKAGRLWGAVERIEESREASLAFRRFRYEQWLESAPRPVTPEDVHAGRAMTLDEAVGYALESDD